jgi:hypothetical protein
LSVGHLVKVVIVIYMAAIWSNDVFRPVVSTPLAGFDNYEIYDLVITNSSVTTEYYNYYPAVESHAYVNTDTRDELFSIGVTPFGITNNADPLNPTAPAAIPYGDGYINGVYSRNWIIFENYQGTTITTPERLVFNRTEDVKVPPRIYAVQRYTPHGAASTDLIYSLLDEFRPLINSPKISWEKLIIKENIKYSGIAQASGLFEIEYWGINYLEGHPLINYTLDYRKVKVRLIKNQPFAFKLYHPVAHSIKAHSILHSATATDKPSIADILAENRIYANSLSVVIAPPSPPPSGQIFRKYGKSFYDPTATSNASTGVGYRLFPSVGWLSPDNPPPISGHQTATYRWIDYRVLRATNQVTASTWGVDADIGDYPAISALEAEQWHFAPQPDGSNGTIIMDGIRTIQTLELVQQIADAIDAATYSKDPATQLPRVANLGHLIEKVANFIGYRPEPDGSIDMQKETTTYAAAVVAPGFNSGVDYRAGRFGKKGALVKRVTNKLGATGKWEPGGYVKVHDLFQLHTELFGQMNQALNLQDSTSITIRDGTNTYSYPNQLALLAEIGTGVIQHRRQIRETWASSIVTQKTVNEVLAGFGLPVVSKSLTVNGQQLPYWGVQPSQSLQKEIATSTYQGGAQLGQLL